MNQTLKYLFLLLFCYSNNLIAQVEVIEVTPTVEVTQAILLGKTKAVRDIVPSGADLSAKKKKANKEKKKPANFPKRRGDQSKAIHLDLEHQGADPIRQSSGFSSSMGIQVEPKVNILGVGNFGSPHDPTGDIGLDYYLQAVNVTVVGVFTKEGVLVQQFQMDDLWSDLGVGSAGDPIILFDESVNRWIITEFPNGNSILVAISDTSDPLGTYNAYIFNTPNFPDYPKYGIAENEIIVTTNESGAGTLVQYFLDKNALYAGAANVTMQRVTVPGNNNTEAGFYVSTPIDVDGHLPASDNRPMITLMNDSSWGAIPEDAVDMYRFDVDFDNPGNTTSELVRIVTTPFDGFPCSSLTGGFACTPQQGGGGLDALPEIIMNVPKYRNLGSHESIVMCFITDVTDGQNLSGIRWMELRKTAGTEWSLYQEGTYAPDDGLDRYVPSIAIDGGGNIGMAYNVSSPDSFVGVRFTGRSASAPLGTMDVDEYIVAEGENSINSGGRFGDYAQMSVDPVDQRTFWYTTEYAAGNNVRTRIVAFEILRDTFDLSASAIVNPAQTGSFSATETVSLNVINSGLSPIGNYTVGFELDNTLIDQMMIPEVLAPDSSILIDFPTTIDLSAFGQYNLKAFVNHPEDIRVTNDTITKAVFHVYGRDMMVEITPGITTCNENVSANFTITNIGAETVNNATIELTVVGGNTITLPYAGNLGFNQSQTINYPITLVNTGVNTVEVSITEVNGMADDHDVDNIASTTFNWDTDLIEATLQLQTDDYPAETSWTVVDDAGNEIASGGSYGAPNSPFEDIFCISLTECYTFTIFDTYGDGICCQFGEGNYALVNANGETIFSSTGEFGDQEVQEFCGNTIECNLSAQIGLLDDTGNDDGSIIISATGGTAPYTYSIDGGANFQSNSLFENLPAGPYQVVVQDANGNCEFTENVLIEMSVSVTELDGVPYEFIINPNPNNGYFDIAFEMSNLTSPRLRLQIMDATGKLVQTKKVGRFNSTYKTTVSLVAYPSGNYYVRLLDGNEPLVIEKVIKI